MKTRVISAVVMIAVTAAFMVISPYTRVFFLLVCSILACYEMCKILKPLEYITVPFIAYAAMAAEAGITLYGMWCPVDAIWSKAVFVTAAAAAIFAGIISRRVGARGAMATLFTLVYPVTPFVLITRMSVMDGWVPVFVTAALATWICDSFALFGGKLFGKHKAAPAVSPNKTWEGCISGAVSSIVSGVIVFFILRSFYSVPLWLYVVTSLVASSMGQIGDLAASLFKRMAGVKDYSNLIPGHGGMLDRADSLLFSIPTAYMCFFLAGLI